MNLSVLIAALPVALLIFVMTKPRPWPSVPAFGMAAALAAIFGLTYWGLPWRLVAACAVAGFLEALTPVSIVAGAVFLFLALEKSGLMDILRQWLRGVSPHPVAQVMVVGWAFGFLIEGAAGFGTPAALAAPVLMGLGFPALAVAAVCLVFNGVCTIFGAVGTPLWFGMGPLDLPPEMLLAIGQNAALYQATVGLIVPVVALRFLFPWRTIARNLLFIWLSLLSCLLPMLLLSRVSYEFPVIGGGAIGLTLNVLLARWRIGLTREEGTSQNEDSRLGARSWPEPDGSLRQGVSPVIPRAQERPSGQAKNSSPAKSTILRRPQEAPTAAARLWHPGLLRALLPLAVTVAILAITRIPALGLRALLTSTEPATAIPIPPLGTLKISAALVLQLPNILGQALHWSYPVLYVPAFIPFAISGLLALALAQEKNTANNPAAVLAELWQRIKTPWLALIGALTLVKLILAGGHDAAPAYVLGKALAATAGQNWKFFAPVLGSLGSFFSGSTTVSNLTFAGTQLAIAHTASLNPTQILALQLSGASAGNMICLHNIIAVCAVLGLANKEGAILRKTILPWLLFVLLLALSVAASL